MSAFTYVTGNPVKAERFGRYLEHPVSRREIELLEIQSLDVEEVALHKANAAFALLRTPVLVEDFSFRIHALGGLPGPLNKWFLQGISPESICRLLDKGTDRSATSQVCLGYHDGSVARTFLGERHGTVPCRPRGMDAFATNTIFIPEGWGKTWAEMNENEKMATSARKLAMDKFKDYLAVT